METIIYYKGIPKTVYFDEEDAHLFSSRNWNVITHTKNLSYVRSKIPGTNYYVGFHRLVMNAPKGFVVDHLNGNGLDNRKHNLRICTNTENVRNIRKSRSPFGFKGIKKNRNRWAASITYNYKCIHIGNFKTQEEAAKAYDEKAIELFGEFACTNKDLGLVE